MMKLKQVTPDDFDVEALRAAARKGLLFIGVSEKSASKEEIKNEVRAYVARIGPFVSKGFRSSVDDLWEQILSNDDFIALLTPGTKARKCKAFDKYNVMRIIGILREKGVYEYNNDSKYNALLEQTDKDTPYRKYLSMGLEQRDLLVELRQIVAQYQL